MCIVFTNVKEWDVFYFKWIESHLFYKQKVTPSRREIFRYILRKYYNQVTENMAGWLIVIILLNTFSLLLLKLFISLIGKTFTWNILMNVLCITNVLSLRDNRPWKIAINYISEHYLQDFILFRRQTCAETKLLLLR